MLDEIGQTGLPITRDQALNERDYGDLSGLNKDDARAKWGEEQVHIWRRSYATAPPGGESLRDTGARVWPYYLHNIQPHVMRGEGVLIAAHGNSLRALIMALDGLTRRRDRQARARHRRADPLPAQRRHHRRREGGALRHERRRPRLPPPGRIWYLVAIGIFLAGMAAMAAFLFTRLIGMDDGLTRFVVPGEQTLTLEAGNYTIFHEPQSVIDGKIYAAPGALGGLTVTVDRPGRRRRAARRRAAPGATASAATPATPSSTSPHASAGAYASPAAMPTARQARETVLAVGAGFLSRTARDDLRLARHRLWRAAIAAVVVGTLVRRRRAGVRF